MFTFVLWMALDLVAVIGAFEAVRLVIRTIRATFRRLDKRMNGAVLDGTGTQIVQVVRRE